MSRIWMVVLVLAGLAHIASCQKYADHDPDLDPEIVQERARTLDLELDKRKQFGMEMRRIHAEIVHENLPLAQAVDQVEQAASSFHPIYLKALFLANKKITSVKVLIGRNIVAGLKNYIGSTQIPPSLDQRLRSEMAELCLANNEKPGS